MDYEGVLRQIVQDPDNRKKLIDEFQSEVWEGKLNGLNADVRNILGGLAYDLDYYEPDLNLRGEDGGYYGDEKLVSEVLEALKKIEGFI